MAETVVDAADGPAVAGEIVDAAGAVDVLVVGEGIVADAAGRVGEGTNFLPRMFADIKGPRRESWSFFALG